MLRLDVCCLPVRRVRLHRQAFLLESAGQSTAVGMVSTSRPDAVAVVDGAAGRIDATPAVFGDQSERAGRSENYSAQCPESRLGRDGHGCVGRHDGIDGELTKLKSQEENVGQLTRRCAKTKAIAPEESRDRAIENQKDTRPRGERPDPGWCSENSQKKGQCRDCEVLKVCGMICRKAWANQMYPLFCGQLTARLLCVKMHCNEWTEIMCG